MLLHSAGLQSSTSRAACSAPQEDGAMSACKASQLRKCAGASAALAFLLSVRQERQARRVLARRKAAVQFYC